MTGEAMVDGLLKAVKEQEQEIARLNKIIDDIKNVIEEKNLWIYVDEEYNYPYIAVKNLEDILYELKEEGKE